jgi:hypothetical protein
MRVCLSREFLDVLSFWQGARTTRGSPCGCVSPLVLRSRRHSLVGSFAADGQTVRAIRMSIWDRIRIHYHFSEL